MKAMLISAGFLTVAVELAAWLERKGLIPRGEPMIANYDPPLTPSFLKRDEIIVRL